VDRPLQLADRRPPVGAFGGYDHGDQRLEELAADLERRFAVNVYGAVDAIQSRTKPRPAQRVAKAVVRAVEARRPRIRYTVGDAKLAGVPARLPTRTRDRALAAALGVSGKGNKDKDPIKGAKEKKSPANGRVS
jgi:hypothetical protein